ncbi:hypothetical protein Ctob_010812 [Chrysochromulina tobinii]|uniref:EF-hand domain-containing protein n=1 Tax=Chrysochromulina tobinii TaxID=1460289 RepID=A0A0M0JA68_9EUKA|nr:hypothetical protein Ctob_010812 [Chrysochromulina tobinii]|eukprot:KOO23123.1 hypothetical protein Ctob_010812 [Chrysochromulina sp. CCMP291]
MPPKQYPKKNLGVLTPTTLRDYFRFNGGKTVIQHFRGLDDNQDGELTLKEFTDGVRAIGFLDATKAECEFVFKWLDNDGSGVVPYKELDKKLRERPIESLAEQIAAAEQAAAKAAADAKKLAKKKPKSPKSPKAEKKAAKEIARAPEVVQPKPLAKAISGEEHYVRPTLAANGYPLFYDKALEGLKSPGKKKKARVSAVSGLERFLKGTIGTASLGTETKATAPKGAEGTILEDTPSVMSDRTASVTDSASPSFRASRPATERKVRPTGMPSFRAARPREPSWAQAERALEAKREEEAERRELVRLAAMGMAEKAMVAPLPTKHPQVWMPRAMASLVAEEEAQLADELAQGTAGGNAAERSMDTYARLEGTVRGLGLQWRGNSLGVVDEDDLWA